jgi:cytochrome c-type biogenesis protein
MADEVADSTAAGGLTVGPVRRLTTFTHAAFFVPGFSTVFILGWGGATTLVGDTFFAYRPLLARIGGVVVILFGLATLGILRLPWIQYDLRLRWNPAGRSGLVPSVLMGVFFAAGWTPCVGVTLSAILSLGFALETAGQGLLLLTGYALGLAIPFLLLGLLVDRATRIVRRLQPHMRWLQIVNGLLLVGMGLLLFSNQMTRISAWALKNGLYFDFGRGSTAAPTYLFAMTAGLLSFLSPCVLPLVPAYLGYLGGYAAKTATPGRPQPQE